MLTKHNLLVASVRSSGEKTYFNTLTHPCGFVRFDDNV
jgi:hypothetical protein